MILHVKSGGNWVHYIENTLYWSFSLSQDDADIHNINRLSIQTKALSVRMVVQILDYPTAWSKWHHIIWYEVVFLRLCFDYDSSFGVLWWCTQIAKFSGVNMGPTWILSAPAGTHVGPMNLAIRVSTYYAGLLHWRCVTDVTLQITEKFVGIILLYQTMKC